VSRVIQGETINFIDTQWVKAKIFSPESIESEVKMNELT